MTLNLTASYWIFNQQSPLILMTWDPKFSDEHLKLHRHHDILLERIFQLVPPKLNLKRLEQGISSIKTNHVFNQASLRGLLSSWQHWILIAWLRWRPRKETKKFNLRSGMRRWGKCSLKRKNYNLISLYESSAKKCWKSEIMFLITIKKLRSSTKSFSEKFHGEPSAVRKFHEVW